MEKITETGVDYSQYRNGKGRDGEADDRSVPTTWLWDELAKFRGSLPHSHTKAAWKIMVGCSRSSGSYPNIKVRVDQRHSLTPREAAGIVLLALWDDILRQSVRPDLRVGRITAEDIPKLFDTWMAISKGKEAATLLQQIFASRLIAYKDLGALTKKPIPPTTLRRWVREAGGKYEANLICPMEVAIAIYQRAKDWEPRHATN